MRRHIGNVSLGGIKGGSGGGGEPSDHWERVGKNGQTCKACESVLTAKER